MTRRPALLGEADLARLLRHMPDPPAPAADLADRVVAAAVAAGNAGRLRPRRRRFGRPLWWAIAVIGVAGAVTAAAANGGRFELARVLEWPQAVIRAAGWAPRHPGHAVARLARPAAPPPVRGAVAPLGERIQPTAPFAFAPRPPAPFGVERPARGPVVLPARAPRLARGPDFARPMLARHAPDARTMDAIRETRREERPEAPLRDADRLPARPELATPAVRPAERTAAANPPRADLDRPKDDDAFLFRDADEFARRQQAEHRDLGARAEERRPWSTVQNDQRRPWASADAGPRRWGKDQAWRQRVDGRSQHPLFHPHPQPRGRRR